MKKQIVVWLFSVVLVLNCAKSDLTLNLYTWADYISPEVIAEFEKRFNCRVIIDTFDSNESMYAKIKAGAEGYDILIPSSYMVQVMQQQDMLLKLDPAKLPNLKNIDENYIRLIFDPQMRFSVPYAVTITGIAYLDGRVADVQSSWSMFNREELKGRMTMLNDMRETIGAALKFLGFSLNTLDEDELQQARDVVISWKRNLAKFENEQYKTGLASEEFLLVHGYSGDILQAQADNESIQFMVPIEGASVAMDEMVIPKSAPQVELAHQFINYLLEPNVAAENTEYTTYLFPNRESYRLLPKELEENPILFPQQEALANAEVIRDLGENNHKYIKIWDEIKAAK